MKTYRPTWNNRPTPSAIKIMNKRHENIFKLGDFNFLHLHWCFYCYFIHFTVGIVLSVIQRQCLCPGPIKIVLFYSRNTNLVILNFKFMAIDTNWSPLLYSPKTFQNLFKFTVFVVYGQSFINNRGGMGNTVLYTAQCFLFELHSSATG